MPPIEKRPHFRLQNTSQSVPYTAHPQGRTEPVALTNEPNRATHGGKLRGDLLALGPLAAQAKQHQLEQEFEAGLGIQLQFIGRPGVELEFESLGHETKGIELLSVRIDGDHTIANVFVPDGRLDHFEHYIEDYLSERKGAVNQALDHKSLVNSIADIRAAELRGLWTDDPQMLPENSSESFYWEVWLPVRGKHGELRDAVVRDFSRLATGAGCTVGTQQVNFPERTVVLMYGSEQQFTQSVLMLNSVAELRRAKETADFFLSAIDRDEQADWQNNLLARLQLPSDIEAAPRVCLLDSGVNRAHPLLESLLQDTDVHTVEPGWGVSDTANHGTGLAGVAAYGDLFDALSSSEAIEMRHLLESVKLVETSGGNIGTPELHANIFADGVSRPEISTPSRSRVFSSAVTAADYRDRGRPSSWSAMIDRLASDAESNGEFPRLFVQAAGNNLDQASWPDYPASLSTNQIHDPGQSWNALTVGAYTQKVVISESDAGGYAPIAPSGCLSPMTSCSGTWDKAWPLKPDVVFEGGNAGQDAISACSFDSLSLLTTNSEHLSRPFATTNATSAASAQCSKMAAQLMAEYPTLRPETIRALIVHSAEWPEAMRGMYLPTQGNVTKEHYANLIRHCGWGVPNFERAMWSARNSLTLLVEDSLHPYKKESGRSTATRDMNIHALPWPIEGLESLRETRVEMRVSLSYFVEPNPSARGLASKFHYPSHRLRFDVRRPLETTADFAARLSAAAAQVDNGDGGNAQDPSWMIGERQRHRGSLHQDTWVGTAAELAARGFLAVYPAMGWWRTRPRLERFNLPARYSLVVSILTPNVDVDLYAEVENKIPMSVQTEV